MDKNLDVLLEIFVPFDIAKQLADLNIVIPNCLALFNREEALRVQSLQNPDDRTLSFKIGNNGSRYPAPTYDQVFDYMYKHYKLFYSTEIDNYTPVDNEIIVYLYNSNDSSSYVINEFIDNNGYYKYYSSDDSRKMKIDIINEMLIEIKRLNKN